MTGTEPALVAKPNAKTDVGESANVSTPAILVNWYGPGRRTAIVAGFMPEPLIRPL